MRTNKPGFEGSQKPKVVIVGGGPAGSSLAIRLAALGCEITLIEKDIFPRRKLCGEFVSPECLSHFNELGVTGSIDAIGPAAIKETRFFSRGGSSVAIPSSWFAAGQTAIGISRAAMDKALLDRAESLGVNIFFGLRVIAIEADAGRLQKLTARNKDGETLEFDADIFIDASGRASILGALVRRGATIDKRTARPTHIGFKTHLRGADIRPETCEIYFFDGGYGGIAGVENGEFNLCCLVESSKAKRFVGKDADFLAALSASNSRARTVLARAIPLHALLTVSISRFGADPQPAHSNLFSVGDAGAFIDPFTGSGILMALEGSRLLSQALAAVEFNLEQAQELYEKRKAQAFRSRLRFSRVLRGLSRSQLASSAAIWVAGRSTTIRSALAKATRGVRASKRTAEPAILLD